MAVSTVVGARLCCYTCGGVAEVTAAAGFDPLTDRDAWPGLPCPIADGCSGSLVPEALN